MGRGEGQWISRTRQWRPPAAPRPGWTGRPARVTVLAVYGGLFYAGALAGLADRVREQLARSGKVKASGPLDVRPETGVIGASTRGAVADATAWLITHR
jgi:hypothetical protein